MRDDKRSILSTRSEMAQTKQFTLAQVKGHNNGTDLWIVIRDKVYDVTKFQNEHPGGEEVLIEVAGKDATTEFDDVGHSDSAIELMANYLVGEIVDADKRSKVTAKKNLLTKKRNAIELHTEFHAWNQYDKKDVIQPESIYENRAIFPLLNTLELYPLDYALKRKLQQHCAELHQIEKMKINLPRPITCKLCAIDIENMALLRIHIISRLHLDREKQIGFKSN